MTGARLPKRTRLRRPPEFRKAFAQGRRLQDSCFMVVYRKRGEPEADTARLGITVAKRSLRRAVDRNRIRRLVRESFRLHRRQLPAVDIVVVAKPGCGTAAGPKLLDKLDRHWQSIIDDSRQTDG